MRMTFGRNAKMAGVVLASDSIEELKAGWNERGLISYRMGQ